MSTPETVASVYVLTPLTRDAGKSRRVIVQGFDVPWRNVMITGCALIVGLIPMAFMWMFVGQVAIFVIPITIGIAFYVIERRTRSGLRLRTYEAALDKRRAVVNLFLCCGVPVDPSQNSVRLLKSSSAPLVRIDDLDSIDIALTGSALSVRRGHEPETAALPKVSRRARRTENAAVEQGLYAPSSHESFWSNRGAPEISDDTTGLLTEFVVNPTTAAAPIDANAFDPTEFDIDAAMASTHIAEPKGLRGRFPRRRDLRQDQPTP